MNDIIIILKVFAKVAMNLGLFFVVAGLLLLNRIEKKEVE